MDAEPDVLHAKTTISGRDINGGDLNMLKARAAQECGLRIAKQIVRQLQFTETMRGPDMEMAASVVVMTEYEYNLRLGKALRMGIEAGGKPRPASAPGTN